MIPPAIPVIESTSLLVDYNNAAPLIGLFALQAAPAASVLVSAAPLPTIHNMKHSSKLPLLPYSTMACNCLLWTAYGVLCDTPSITAPNGVGVLLSVYYMWGYILQQQNSQSSGNQNNQHTAHHVQAVASVAAACAVALVLGSTLSTDMIAQNVGHAAMLFCVGLFASPLSVLKDVIAQKNADAIPLPMAVASVAACALWTAAGTLELHDVNVIVPNALGLLCGMAQVGLKIYYYGNEDDATTRIQPELQSQQHTVESLDALLSSGRATIPRKIPQEALSI